MGVSLKKIRNESRGENSHKILYIKISLKHVVAIYGRNINRLRKLLQVYQTESFSYLNCHRQHVLV